MDSTENCESIDSLRLRIYEMELWEKTLQGRLDCLATQICNEMQEKAALKAENEKLRRELEKYKPAQVESVRKVFKQPQTVQSTDHDVMDPVSCVSYREKSKDIKRAIPPAIPRPILKPSMSARWNRTKSNNKDQCNEPEKFENPIPKSIVNRASKREKTDHESDDGEDGLASYLPTKLNGRKEPPRRGMLLHSGSFKKARTIQLFAHSVIEISQKAANDSTLFI